MRTNLSEEELANSRKKKKKHKSGPVETKTVEELLHETAVDLCDGDVRRLQIVSTTEIIVHNNANWRK